SAPSRIRTIIRENKEADVAWRLPSGRLAGLAGGRLRAPVGHVWPSFTTAAPAIGGAAALPGGALSRGELVLPSRQEERELFRFVVVHVGVGVLAKSHARCAHAFASVARVRTAAPRRRGTAPTAWRLSTRFADQIEQDARCLVRAGGWRAVHIDGAILVTDPGRMVTLVLVLGPPPRSNGCSETDWTKD